MEVYFMSNDYTFDECDGFIFSEYDGGYSLDNYQENDPVVVVPDTYNGKPIVHVSNLSFVKDYHFYKSFSPTEIFQNFNKNIISANKDLVEIILPESVVSIQQLDFFLCPKLRKITCLNPNTVLIYKNLLYCNLLVDVSFCLWEHFNKIYYPRFAISKCEDWANVSDIERKQILDFIKRRMSLKHELFSSNSLATILILIENNVTISIDKIDFYLENAIKHKNTLITATLIDYKNKNFTKKNLEKFTNSQELISLGFAYPTLKELRQNWFIQNAENGIYITGYKGFKYTEIIPQCTQEGMKILGIKHTQNKFAPIENLTIFADFEVLEDNVFNSFSTLKSINLPQTLKSIGKSAFWNCYALENINIPDSVTEILSEAFSSCKSLTTLTLPDSISVIETSVFSHCTNLKNINLPQNLEVINPTAFYYCLALENVNFPKSLRTIHAKAFSDCKSLHTAIFNSKVTLHTRVFSSCPLLKITQN